MEEIAEGALKSLLRLLGYFVRFLIWLIWELCFEIVAWYVGWPICRVISIGNLPREAISEYEKATPLTNFAVSLVGLLVLIGAGSLIAILVGSG